MSQKDQADESLRLRELSGRDSKDSANSSDLEHMLSENAFETTSTDMPHPDSGRGAWMCHLGCCLLEATLWDS